MGESSAEDTYIYAETLAAELGQVSASAYLANTRQRIDRAIMVLGDGRVAEDTSAGLLPPKSAIEDVPRSTVISTKKPQVSGSAPACIDAHEVLLVGVWEQPFMRYSCDLYGPERRGRPTNSGWLPQTNQFSVSWLVTETIAASRPRA